MARRVQTPASARPQQRMRPKLLRDKKTGRALPVLARHSEWRTRLIDAKAELGLGVRAAEEFAFHMTDWTDDLKAFVRLVRSPARHTDAEVVAITMAFLVHAPAHIAAARRILMNDPLTDVFALGAVKGSGVPRRKPGSQYKDSPPTSGAAKPRRKRKAAES